MGRKLVVEASGLVAMSGVRSTHEDRQHDDSMDCSGDLMEEYFPDVESIWILKDCIDRLAAFEPKMVNLLNVSSKDVTKLSPVRRNQSAYNLKCLTAFYSYPLDVFCLALNTLDRFITKVKVQPRYLSCITTTCFYYAAKAIQGTENAPSLDMLIRVSQSDCRSGDITRMGTIIHDKLQSTPAATAQYNVTVLSLMRILVDTYRELSHIDISNHMNKLSSKLVMCLCHAELLNMSLVHLALAVFGAHLQSLAGSVDDIQAVAFATILNICQISDREFLPYQEQITQFLIDNYSSPSPLPKLQLKWTISNRTMSRLRPGYYGDTDLPVIPETPYDCLDISRASSVESLTDMEIDDDDDDVETPGTPTLDDFNHHFSYPNSPSEPSPISQGLPPCHILTYADVVSGRLYLNN